MRPYIGILIDSFWEAISNRVLWALLICWTLLLAGLAPFGYVVERSYKIASFDIGNRGSLVKKIASGAKGKGSASVQAVVDQMDEDFVEKATKAAKDDSSTRLRSSELAKELNKVLESPELYSQEAFPTADRRKALQPLIALGPEERTKEDNEELNRKLLQLSFPLELNENFGERLWVGYAGFKLSQEPLPFSRRQAREFIEPIALTTIIKLGLGVLAIFVAVIVTSPIIPDTFRSGSLHLLLSKPISRVLLYLSKFFGGTTFVLVNIGFVLTGLYFIAGIRFEIWNEGLLLCIPLLLFVFIIFYSISGLVGLIWGNAIVCVVSCIVFWFGCFCLQIAQGIMQPSIEINAQITRSQKIEGQLTTVDEEGDFNVWNPEFQVWQPAIETLRRGPRRTFGPLYDAERRKVLVKSFGRNPLGGIFGGNRSLNIVDLSQDATLKAIQGSAGESQAVEGDAKDVTSTGSSEITEASEDTAPSEDTASSEDSIQEGTTNEVQSGDQADGESTDADEDEAESEKPQDVGEARKKARWTYDSGPKIPENCFQLAQMQGRVFAVCRDGVYLLDLSQLDIIQAGEKALFGLVEFSSFVGNQAFQKVSPKDFTLTEKSRPAAAADDSGFVIYAPGKLEFLEWKDEKLELTVTKEIQLKSPEVADDEEEEGASTREDLAAEVRMNADYCVVVRDGMPLAIFDREFNLKAEVELESGMEVKRLAFQPNSNRLSLVTHSGELVYLDCDNSSVGRYSLPFSGSVTSADWTGPNQVFVGVQPHTVYHVDVESGEILESFQPTPSIFESIYRIGVRPLYTILPKPAALDDAMLYALTGRETQSLSIVTTNLEAARVELSVWGPILSNLAFVIVVLGIGCIYVARKEF